MKKTVLGLLALGSITGCGNGTEPLSALNDPTVTPQLTLPFSTSQVSLYSITPYSTATSTANDGFDFVVSTYSGANSIFAPAPGIVTNTDGNSVTIYHNTRLSTRVSKINVGTTPGTVVTTASIIGTGPISNTTTLAHLQVILDGSVVCPYFYLVGGDATQRTYINAKFFGSYPYPCQ